MPVRTITVIASSLLLAFAPGASAAGCQGPSGAGAISQYCESVPNASGGSDAPGQATSGSSSKVSKGTADSLGAAGRDGQDVLNLTKNSASGSGGTSSAASTKTSGGTGNSNPPSPSDSGASKSGSASGTSSASGVAPPQDRSSNPLRATTSAVATGSTVGPLLLWVLVGMAILAAIVGVASRRRRGRPDTPDAP